MQASQMLRPAKPEQFFELIFPYLDDVVVGVECVFCWHPKGISVGHTGLRTCVLIIKSNLFSVTHYT